MRIGLIDVDGHNYPNLCLMKLSAHHKSLGDQVEWYSPDGTYDIVYMSKVFSDVYSPDVPEPTNTTKVIRGGTGYAIKLEDGKEVYHPELDPPSYVLPLTWRPDFLHGAKSGSPTMECLWTVWSGGHETIYCPLKKPKEAISCD